MALNQQGSAKSRVVLAFCLFMLALAACKSRSSETVAESRSAASDVNSGAHIDLLCIGDRINAPSEPFHYSYKYSDESNSLDNEADISPQKIDITATDKTGTHAYHGVRSDEASWNAAVLDLSSLRFTGMTSRIDSLNGSSSITSNGPEAINGYNTTKYSIDTEQASSADRRQFQTLFGGGSFEKGTAWVPADGCAVKLDLEESIVQGNGKVTKGHYELAMTRR